VVGKVHGRPIQEPRIKDYPAEGFDIDELKESLLRFVDVVQFE
jgi:hypothetical protein